jgi:hypothetical protein
VTFDTDERKTGRVGVWAWTVAVGIAVGVAVSDGVGRVLGLAVDTVGARLIAVVGAPFEQASSAPSGSTASSNGRRIPDVRPAAP